MGGFIGAKVLHVLTTHPEAVFTLAPWINLTSGLSIHGGLLGGLLSVYLFTRRAGVGFLGPLDTMALAVPLGQAIGRVGCFLAGGDYGKPTDLPWGVTYTDPLAIAPVGVPLHPSQLYESVAAVIIFALLWRMRDKAPAGGLALAYGSLYGLARFMIEFTRGGMVELSLLGVELTLTQWLSLPLIVLLGMLYWRWRKVATL